MTPFKTFLLPTPTRVIERISLANNYKQSNIA